MEKKTIQRLIQYHRSGLSNYGSYMSATSKVLIEQTIKALEELKEKK